MSQTRTERKEALLSLLADPSFKGDVLGAIERKVSRARDGSRLKRVADQRLSRPYLLRVIDASIEEYVDRDSAPRDSPVREKVVKCLSGIALAFLKGPRHHEFSRHARTGAGEDDVSQVALLPAREGAGDDAAFALELLRRVAREHLSKLWPLLAIIELDKAGLRIPPGAPPISTAYRRVKKLRTVMVDVARRNGVHIRRSRYRKTRKK